MPGAGPLGRTDFPKLFASRLPYIDKLIGPDSWKEIDNQWMQYFNIRNSDRMREDFLEYAGFGLFRSIGEHEKVTYDQMIQGPSKSVLHTLFGLGFEIGYLVGKHDIDGIVAKNAPELGRSMRVSLQTLAAALWNGSFSTTLTADGQYLCDTDHTYIRGSGTWANAPLVATALGHAALESAIVTFSRLKDPMQNPMTIQPQNLLIPPELAPMAHELLQSQLRHDTTTHAESYVHGKLTPHVWPFLTSSTAWWVLAPQNQLQIYWYWSVKPETSHGLDFDTGAGKTKTLFACSTVAVDPRGVYGTAGA